MAQEIARLPDEFRKAMDNIEIVVEDRPNDEDIEIFEDREGSKKGHTNFILLGLYRGIPLGKRDPQFYSGVLPDKVSLFKESIEEVCGGNEREMAVQIRKTLLHEIGHYFGMEDEKLRRLGY